MNRYGISSWIVKWLPLDEAVETLSASGFKELELSCAQSALVQAWEKAPREICRRLELAGLHVKSTHTPEQGRQLSAAEEAPRRTSLDANRQYIDWSAQCGVELLIIHPTGPDDFSTEESRAASKARAVESMRILAEYAEGTGVKLAMENLPSGKVNRPGATMSELREMIEGLGAHVGLCFDIGHTVMKGLDPVEELKAAGDKLLSLHLHDVNAQNHDHFIPGEGTIDWEAFLTQLDRQRFEGLRILEVSPPEENAKERLRATAAVRDKWEAG